jgi:ribosomal protein S18 acetylase RimI-like enzyme
MLQALRAALPPGLALRERTQADLPALATLYASTREDELRPVEWPPEQKLAFLHDQFDKQHRHYLAHYPQAQWLVVTQSEAVVGRIYLEVTALEVRVMDIAFLPTQRSHGSGTALMRALIEQADEMKLPVTLHVEPFNPAHAWYERLGFADVETRGYYRFMRRPAGGAG